MEITWLTSPQGAKDRAMWTIGKPSSPITINQWEDYLTGEHSILHSVILSVKMTGLDQFSSVHFARHKHADHYVASGRPDWTGKGRSLDDTKNHWMDANCQALIDIAKKRLCNRASAETHEAMSQIKFTLLKSEDHFMQVLSTFLVPSCVYRGGRCFEGRRTCGMYPRVDRRFYV